jgi:hypothetical protein
MTMPHRYTLRTPDADDVTDRAYEDERWLFPWGCEVLCCALRRCAPSKVATHIPLVGVNSSPSEPLRPGRTPQTRERTARMSTTTSRAIRIVYMALLLPG